MSSAWAAPAADGAQTGGMISIEVVEQPTFWDYAGEYGYLALIVALFGWFLWRKLALRKK